MDNDIKKKKFYWIKLKTDFFNRKEIDFLLSQNNGCEYIVLYQMLCLITANDNGELKESINEIIIPFDINKIARDTKYFDYDTIVVALELYKKLGLIYEQNDKILKITNYQEMIGCETSYAQQKRAYRNGQKEVENTSKKEVGHSLDIVRQEIRDKSIEYRYKNIYIYTDEKHSLDDISLVRFDTFWSCYPKKETKIKCQDWFKKNTLDDTTFDIILNSLEKFKKCKQWKTKQFIPQPITWLNQKRWLDEIEEEESEEENAIRLKKEIEEEEKLKK
ncbi:MAG: phage replisome organizer N-terminal domain-containing protein [Bacilli bacterium]